MSEFSKVWIAFLVWAQQTAEAKEMDTLKKILSNAEIVNIKYPEKVFTISFISQYFAFNVCSLAFPQAL